MIEPSVTQLRQFLIEMFQRGFQLLTITIVRHSFEISQDSSTGHLQAFALLPVTDLLVGQRRGTGCGSLRLCQFYLGFNFLTFPSACHTPILALWEADGTHGLIGMVEKVIIGKTSGICES